jgi:hypothetical protein
MKMKGSLESTEEGIVRRRVWWYPLAHSFVVRVEHILVVVQVPELAVLDAVDDAGLQVDEQRPLEGSTG